MNEHRILQQPRLFLAIAEGQTRNNFRTHVQATRFARTGQLPCRSTNGTRSALDETQKRHISKRYGAKRGESKSLLKYTTPEQAARFKRCKDDEYDIVKYPVGIWV